MPFGTTVFSDVLNFCHGDRSVFQFLGLVVRDDAMFENRRDVRDGYDVVEFGQFIARHNLRALSLPAHKRLHIRIP